MRDEPASPPETASAPSHPGDVLRATQARIRHLLLRGHRDREILDRALGTHGEPSAPR